MIWFEEVTNRKKISRIFNTYQRTFPEEERRDKNQFLELSENPNVYILNIKNDDDSIGYCIIWQLNDFWFLEHFEVFEDFRNKKYGSEILQNLIEKYENIILESEPETQSEIANRRILFYQRNGFNIIDKSYIQPSYGEGKPTVNLWLLGNFTPKNSAQTIDAIYTIVYEQ